MRSKGFSLIELVIVLILLSLSVSLVVPSLFHISRRIELRGAAKKVSGILRYCRSEAINKGMVFQVLFNSELREVKVQSVKLTEEKAEDEKQDKLSEKIYSFPEGINMREVKVSSAQYPSDFPTIEFYPNGGSNGGSVLLGSQDQRGYRIKVNFLTGLVEIEEI